MKRSQTSIPRRLAAPVATLCLAALFGGCAPGQHGGFQMPPMPVEVSPVLVQTVTDQFHAVGTIEANETVKMVNEISAVVREMPFAEGQTVRKGALIARLEDSDLRAEATRAEALRDQARTNHQRVKLLFDQKAASQQEMDDAGSALKVAEANDALARTRLAKAYIHSPLTGLVGRRMVSPGSYLQVGQLITEVASVDVMKISFAAPERYLPELHLGAPMEITTTAYPGRVFVGRISVVDPILDAASRTVQLEARIPNRGNILRPGMSADVTANLGQRPRALVVPDEAVFGEGDQSYVYVVKPDSTVMRQAVVIGSRDSVRAEISQGLKEGDHVVRAGYQKLFEGAKVMPMPPGGPGGANPAGSPGAAAASGKAPAAPAASPARGQKGGK